MESNLESVSLELGNCLPPWIVGTGEGRMPEHAGRHGIDWIRARNALRPYNMG